MKREKTARDSTSRRRSRIHELLHNFFIKTVQHCQNYGRLKAARKPKLEKLLDRENYCSIVARIFVIAALTVLRNTCPPQVLLRLLNFM